MIFRWVLRFKAPILNWGELEGETGILGKRENWCIFILLIGDRILMKFDIWKEFMSQSSYFRSRPDLLTLGGDRGGNRKSWKTLRVEESG